ncbi:hypothetical protein LCGC14_2925710 [marine sediment metagenome]|uniref:Uncharacterized protein n=1 Tax=marine sediment metagenome TaxID=412755 RepID=A0A0F9ADG7_9ZZZZ
MSFTQVKCDNCGVSVIFDEDPYNNPIATRYWKSTYEKPEKSLFIVQRKIPSQNKKGKITYQIFNEHILQIYCGVKCGLEEYELTKKAT